MAREISTYIITNEQGSIAVLFALFAYWVYDAVNRYQENGFSRGAYFSIIISILLAFIFAGFIIFPIYLNLSLFNKPESNQLVMAYMTVGTIRWFFLYAVLCPLLFFSPYTSNKLKSGMTMFAHLSIFLIGWIFGQWLGFFFISLPILAIFYLFLYHLTQAVFPATNPESTVEKHYKARVFLWYIWGLQYPLWVAANSATRYSDKRIDGGFIKRVGVPGIIWTYSHQVVARSTGIELNNIVGPGILFTKRSERPVALVDLRTQLRPTEFVAVTKDGIEITAIVFISFQIDRTSWKDWSREEKHAIWRTNPVLQKGMELKTDPFISYPYSNARVRTALSASSIDFSENDDTVEERYWDEVAIQRVLKEARLVLSERNFNELWIPVENDNRGTGAIDEMSTEIKKRAEPELKKMGVQLFGSRIVHFIIDKDTSIYKQLKESWLFAWNKKIDKIKFDGAAEAERLKIEAKMSSRRIFMETVAETLQQAQGINNNVLRQLTTLNLISTLEKLLEDGDNEEDAEQQTARISAWGRFLSRSSRER